MTNSNLPETPDLQAVAAGKCTAAAPVNLNRTPALISAFLLGTVGLAVLLIMPLLVGALIEHRNFDQSQAGIIAASDLLGGALAALATIFFIRRVSWKKSALVALLIVVGGNILSFNATSFEQLLGLRLATGMGSGLLMSAIIAHLSDTRNPDRNFAFLMLSQTAFSCIVFVLLPDFIAAAGADGIFLSLAALSAVAMLLISQLPDRGLERSDSQSGSYILSKPVLMGLLGSACFFIAQTSLWAYIERMGVAAQLSPESIAQTLSITTLFALLGPLTASWIGHRFRRVWPLAAVVLGQCLALSMLTGTISSLSFIIAIAVFQFFWGFAISYQMAAINDADPSGRSVLLCVPVQGLGLAMGPGLAAMLISGNSYLAIIVLAGVMGILSFLLLLPAIVKR